MGGLAERYRRREAESNALTGEIDAVSREAGEYLGDGPERYSMGSRRGDPIIVESDPTEGSDSWEHDHV